MSKRDEEIFNETLGSLFSMISGVPVKVVQVSKNAAKTAEKTAKKAAETARECAACYNAAKSNYEPKLTDFIDNIICQDSAVVIFWKDGTKTTAKCGKDDTFDYEKGLAIATLKYVFGNKVYQEDMKTLMEAYPRAKSSAKKKTIEKTEIKKTSTSKKSSSSKSKSTNKKSTSTKKTSNKKSNDDIPF